MEEKFMTLEEVAEALRLSISYVRHVWPSWLKFGIRPIRVNGRGRKILITESDFNLLVEKWSLAK